MYMTDEWNATNKQKKVPTSIYFFNAHKQKLNQLFIIQYSICHLYI